MLQKFKGELVNLRWIYDPVSVQDSWNGPMAGCTRCHTWIPLEERETSLVPHYVLKKGKRGEECHL
jgi:hypothetical protein